MAIIQYNGNTFDTATMTDAQKNQLKSDNLLVYNIIFDTQDCTLGRPTICDDCLSCPNYIKH